MEDFENVEKKRCKGENLNLCQGFGREIVYFESNFEEHFTGVQKLDSLYDGDS